MADLEEHIQSLALPSVPLHSFERANGALFALRKWRRARAAALLGGLLTVPDFHANGNRLDWLLRLVISFSSGHKDPTQYDLSQALNRGLGNAGVIYREDPPEELFSEQEKMVELYPKVVAEIDNLVASIASQVVRLPPEQLLHRAWWEFASIMIGLKGKVADVDQLSAMRMLDYVQSVIASVPPQPYAEAITEEEWQALKGEVSTLFHRLTLDYQLCLTAWRKVQDPALDMQLEEFRFRAETLWMNIRGKRYHAHERQALLDVLSPHTDVLLRLYGIDAEGIADELNRILAKLTRGLGEAMQGMLSFRDETLDRFEAIATADPTISLDRLREKVFEDVDLAARRDKVMGELFGMDLFDVSKNTALPQLLVDDLSWSPGEEEDFFAPGDFRGWPLRIWPVMRRPFIKLGGRSLSFDIFSLFDNIYRVLRRAIVEREPTYAASWNDRQKAVSEELPFLYFDRLLPGAQMHRSVYYRWKVGSGPAQWHEADGIIIFDDHLLVIEVKAGAFTYTSPANDLPAHLASLRNLLEAPARQGSRFVDYLESSDEITISDADHHETARLRRGDFRHVTVCTITLDAFTELAARAQHLAPLGINVGHRQIWPISIDDLRVYAEIFDNPLTFLHFIEQRVKAGQAEDVDLNDEMDHLGLYLVQNNYSQFAKELKGGNRLSKLNFDGYRTPIDEYFKALIGGAEPDLPRQDMPSQLQEIVDFLAISSEPRRSELAAFLLNAEGDFRTTLANAIEDAKREIAETTKARPLSFYGDMAMTVQVWSPVYPRLKTEVIQHARAVLFANQEDSRPLVELEYAADGSIDRAHLTHVTLAGIGEDELQLVKAASEKLVERRMDRARANGKIGRNEPCPCGSGMKFKRCHGL